MIRYNTLTVHQFPCLHDNYGYLIRDDETGTVAAIDTPDSSAIAAELEKLGWPLDFIFNTHWHHDHVGGNVALKNQFGAKIVGPLDEGDRIPGRDQSVTDGDEVSLGHLTAKVISAPGHTKGHILYHFENENVVFVGDVLFSLGCGRLFEGTPAQMWDSLSKIKSMAPETTVYCAHEYTEDLAKFSLSVAPKDAALVAKNDEILKLRAAGKPTVPMILKDELATNLFLRADDPMVAAYVDMAGAAPVDVFTEIRKRKDNY